MQPTYVRKLKKEKPKEIYSSQFTADNLDLLNTSFELTDWDLFINSSKDIDELTDVVTEYMKFNINSVIPKKKIKVFGNNKPWITSTLWKNIVEKHMAHSTNSPDYTEKQRELDKAISKAKSDYKDRVEDLFRENNMKDAWKGLKCLTGQSSSKKPCALTKEAGSAERLNHFYARFDKEDFSHELLDRKERLVQNVNNSDPIMINKEDIVSTFRKICVKKAPGPDSIGALVLKKCCLGLLDIIHHIYQKSITECRVPSLWKLGEIVPVSKKPIAKTDNDLRPVTLTPILCKCLERIILPKLQDNLLPHIDSLQFAYLKGRSTDDAISSLVHFTNQHLDESPSNYVRCLFIDYSSAFNTMLPHLLIDKLQHYNVHPNLQLWILDFLTNRSQHVRTDLETSPRININTGAPQGCVLSAFLFIVYTNELCENNKSCKIIKYADDTVVVGLIKDNDESKYENSISYVSNGVLLIT